MTPQELKQARLRLGLSQQAMADLCAIPWRTYQDRERGVSEIKGDFAKLVQLLLDRDGSR